MKTKKVGLYFGSFNPIHIGHLILANYILEFSDLEELWFVVTPHSPFKEKKSLLEDNQRLDMVQQAIAPYPKMRASNAEFFLPKPSYTVDTLAYLNEKHPSYSFSLIMGEDNLKGLSKWKNSHYLIENYEILVYPRLSEDDKPTNYPDLGPNIHLIEAPIIEISSTEIRQMIKDGKNVRPMLPVEVYDYLEGSSFYKS